METALSQPASSIDPDSALIRSMAAGDEGALRTLYAVYGRRLFAYAYRLTANQATAILVLLACAGAAPFRFGAVPRVAGGESVRCG